MAAEKVAATVTPADLTALIGTLAEDAKERREAKQVPVSQAKLETPWNPGTGTDPDAEVQRRFGSPRKAKLDWKYVTQNGARLNEVMMTDEEITLLNQLRPGVYNQKRIQVLRRRDKSIDIRYANKTFEQRMDLKNYARNIVEICQNIVTEMEAQKKRRQAGEFEDDDN